MNTGHPHAPRFAYGVSVAEESKQRLAVWH